MKKTRCFCVVLLQIAAMASACAQVQDLWEIRRDFKIGHKNKEICQQHLDTLRQHAASPLEKGYEAAYTMFMANHTSNPFKKLGPFKKGRKMLEKTIADHPDEVELRYIRLCIQYYIPSFLGYKGNIEEDKAFVAENLGQIDCKATKKLIFGYLKGAEMYSEDELARLESALANP